MPSLRIRRSHTMLRPNDQTSALAIPIARTAPSTTPNHGNWKAMSTDSCTTQMILPLSRGGSDPFNQSSARPAMPNKYRGSPSRMTGQLAPATTVAMTMIATGAGVAPTSGITTVTRWRPAARRPLTEPAMGGSRDGPDPPGAVGQSRLAQPALNRSVRDSVGS